MDSEKRQLETRIHEFKARVSNLQQELDNSVAVQNDFVRLSQSLQMELEKIRSQATEVTLIKAVVSIDLICAQIFHFRTVYVTQVLDFVWGIVDVALKLFPKVLNF